MNALKRQWSNWKKLWRSAGLTIPGKPLAAMLSLSCALLPISPLRAQQVPVIDTWSYTPIKPEGCIQPWCEATNRAVFMLSIVPTATPVLVQHSFDLLSWETVSKVPMVSTNGTPPRWYWGEYVNTDTVFYRLIVAQ